jgi:(E)-4-hydroxy-3-methyl-but-2-enyl pyrophosphate reductase
MIKIYLDKHAGFCSGVKRTLKRALEISLEKENIVSLGEIIHNPVIIKSLNNSGIFVVNNKEEINNNNFVIIRAHGIPPETENWLRNNKIQYKDLTCPKVKNIHKTISRYADKNYKIVIIGNPVHPEVTGHLGYAGDKGVLISDLKKASEFHTDKKVLIIAQTTISESFFNEAAGILEKNLNSKNITVLNTICSSVKKQQAWIKKYSEISDAALIIGGKKSSNTQKLFNIAEKNGKAYWIENHKELDSEIFNFSTIAVTAGASTPDDTIEKVLSVFKDKKAEILQC